MSFRIATFVVTIVLGVSFSGRAQHKANGIEEINNTKGDKHVKIAGTNVYIIPPHGFMMTATQEAMFDPLSGARITVTQRARPFEDDFDSPQHLGEVINQHRIRVNQFAGYYRSIRVSKEFLKEMITFGNENVTVIIVGSFSTNNEVTVNNIRTVMRSAVLLSEKIPDPSDEADFKVDVRGTKLKFARMLNRMLVYTESGTMSSSTVGFYVQFIHDMTGPPDVLEAMTERFLRDRLLYSNVEITESKPITVDGMSGYEITAKGTRGSITEMELLYFVTLFSNKGAYILFGTASKQFEENLEMFRQVARTFYVKEKQQ